MKYTLYVTVHLKTLLNTIEFLQMTHLFLGLGYFDDSNNSFRFLLGLNGTKHI